MKALDRIVVTLGALIVFGAGATVVIVVAGWNGTLFVIDLLAAMHGASRVEAGLLGLLGAAIGLYLLALAWQRDDAASDIRLEAEGGDIRISLKAIESIVFEAAAEVDGVSETTAKLGSRDGELLLDVAVQVSSERPMPDVARDVQQRVGARLSHVTGVPVARLNVHVRGVSRPRRQRVE